MRYIGLIGLLVCLCAGQAAARHIVYCDDAMLAAARDLDKENAKSFSPLDLGKVSYASGTRSDFGFTIGYVIDEGGHVACILTEPTFDLTPERRAYLEKLMDKTFTPRLVNGQATRVYEESMVQEEELPEQHVARPADDPAFTQIQLESHGRRSGDGPFTMVITGNGIVIYIPSRFDYGWILGPQTYHIPPQDVAAMLDLAEQADFWSLRDTYRPAPYPEDSHFPGDIGEDVYRQVTISSSDNVKSLRLYDMGRGGNGAPDAADALIYRITELGRIRLWHSFTRETVAQLVQNGFNFRSERGGELLIDMTRSTFNSDADIDALLVLGAPQDHINYGRYLLETALLDAAIDSGRTALVDRLIAGGALLVNGHPDPVKASRALAHAAASASPDMVARLLALHPPLVFHETTPYENDVPVISLVGQNGGGLAPWEAPDDKRFHDLTTVTQQLLDAGTNINARGTAQFSLLDNAVHDGDIRFVTWLIAHGAKATNETFVPMIQDDITVLLLGTAPELDNETWHVIAANAEPKTVAWLKAHGRWPEAK
jgi:hypothetical protein